MSLLFWGLATTMLATAIGFVVFPLVSEKKSSPMPWAAVVVVVSLLATGLYLGLGSPDALDAGHQQARANPFNSNSASAGRSGTSLASVGNLVDGLRSRLEQEPDDAGGWLLLARSYEHLGRYQDAADAYEQAKFLGKADSDLEKTLLAGKVVETTQTNIDPLPSIRGRVALTPEAASQVNPDDTIFIFAKESPEHRMPVVALRKPAAKLPFDFVLTDAQAMVAGTHLADYETLVVTARVSRSGMATDSVAGLEVWSDPVSPTTGSEIDLLISVNSQAGVASDE